jgi:hypothetical protein
VGDGCYTLHKMWRRPSLIRGRKSRFSVRHVVVLLAVLAISASVATRTFHAFDLDHPSAQSDPSRATRQHLDADAVAFAQPVSDLGTLLLPVAAPHAPPAEVPVHTILFTESVYNRPPPPISLL